MYLFGNGCREISTRKNILQENENISKFIIDETQIKVGKDYFWLWVVAIEPKDKDILHIHIHQKETHVCCRTFSAFFFSKEVWKYPVSSDGGVRDMVYIASM
jgi:transposase-like protein